MGGRRSYTTEQWREIIAADRGGDPRWPITIANAQGRSHGAIINLLVAVERSGLSLADVEGGLNRAVKAEDYSGVSNFLAAIRDSRNPIRAESNFGGTENPAENGSEIFVQGLGEAIGRLSRLLESDIRRRDSAQNGDTVDPSSARDEYKVIASRINTVRERLDAIEKDTAAISDETNETRDLIRSVVAVMGEWRKEEQAHYRAMREQADFLSAQVSTMMVGFGITKQANGKAVITNAPR